MAAGVPLFGGAILALAFLPAGSSPYFADLPVSGAVGKERGFLRFNGVIRASLAALLHLHCGSQAAIRAWEHHRGLRLLHIRTRLFRLLDLALNQLKLAVAIRIRDCAYYVRVTSRERVPFLFCYLHQCFRSIGISTEGARDRSHRSRVQLHRFLFDVLVRFEFPSGPPPLEPFLFPPAIAP